METIKLSNRGSNFAPKKKKFTIKKIFSCRIKNSALPS